MVVRAVPGTVAGHQRLALNPGCDTTAPSSLTIGSGAISHAPAIVHLPGPAGWGCTWSELTVIFGTERDIGALLFGIVAGSCGNRYPACPFVWTGHGLEPSSKSIMEKSGG